MFLVDKKDKVVELKILPQSSAGAPIPLVLIMFITYGYT